MITGICPGCGLRADLDAFLAAGEWNVALAAALTLPAPLAGRVMTYLRLFSPPSHRLTPKKAARLLTELAAAVKAAEVTRRGETFPAPEAYWAEALDLLAQRPPERLPLDDHGYLFEVMMNIAKRAQHKQAQKGEDRRHDSPVPRRGDVQPVARVVDRVAGKAGVGGLKAALGRR